MVSQREIQLDARRAASAVHRDLRMDLGENSYINVYSAILKRGALLMFRPLDGLLGVYMVEGGNRGILVNTRRPIGVQRFTAAHELGHLVMGHEPHADDDNILRRSPLASIKGVPRQEREADAFASYFLLPSFALAGHFRRHAIAPKRFIDPHVVYQASLRLGASYSATVYALERERQISRSVRADLLATRPRDLKTDLVKDQPVENWSNKDVWKITEKDQGQTIRASRGDLFLIKLKENRGAGYLWSFEQLQESGLLVLEDSVEVATDTIGDRNTRWVLGDTTDLNEGNFRLEERRFFGGEEVSTHLDFSFSQIAGRKEGLYELEAAD